ncbi:ENDOV Endonuclease, partial [Glaucidium brasilianum]|nr:ENDOV Endonuclease [Glaucidium brasilianum]
ASEQAQLQASVVGGGTEEWQKDPSLAGGGRVGGVDLSYIKGGGGSACASLVVLSYPALEVLQGGCRMVAVSAPYVAGGVAFREVPFLVEAGGGLQQEQPKLKPQVGGISFEGGWLLAGFGVACHLGGVTDLPCVGVAKNRGGVDGLARDELHREGGSPGGGFIATLLRGGENWGSRALRSCNNGGEPLYVSVGHRVSRGGAVRLVKSCCRYRGGEPIRQ